MRMVRSLLKRQGISAIHINMRYKQKNNSKIGGVVLGFGVVSFLVSVGIFLYLKQANSLLENSVLQTAPQKSHLPVLDRDEVEQVQNATRQLNIPWDKLFSAIESVRIKNVHIVSINPEPFKYTFTLMAESGTLKEMLAYVEVLSSQKTLRNVHLISQQRISNDKTEIIEFVVEGNWGDI